MKVGEQAWVMNQASSGKFFVEGLAVIREDLGDHRYNVQFLDEEGQPDSEETYERYVHEEAQADPKAFAAKLNDDAAETALGIGQDANQEAKG